MCKGGNWRGGVGLKTNSMKIDDHIECIRSLHRSLIHLFHTRGVSSPSDRSVSCYIIREGQNSVSVDDELQCFDSTRLETDPSSFLQEISKETTVLTLLVESNLGTKKLAHIVNAWPRRNKKGRYLQPGVVLFAAQSYGIKHCHSLRSYDLPHTTEQS